MQVSLKKCVPYHITAKIIYAHTIRDNCINSVSKLDWNFYQLGNRADHRSGDTLIWRTFNSHLHTYVFFVRLNLRVFSEVFYLISPLIKFYLPFLGYANIYYYIHISALCFKDISLITFCHYKRSTRIWAITHDYFNVYLLFYIIMYC